jgi:hypothetical protein
MSDGVKVKVLRDVRVADGTHQGRVIVAGTEDVIGSDIVAGLVAEGFVAVVDTETATHGDGDPQSEKPKKPRSSPERAVSKAAPEQKDADGE